MEYQLKFSVGLTMFPQAMVEGKVIFRDNLNVREVFKHFFFFLPEPYCRGGALDVASPGNNISIVEVGERGTFEMQF